MLDLSDLSDIQGALLRADFGMYCEAALMPYGQAPAAHHRLVIAKLQAVAEGKIKRLMVCMPPGSAKTTYISQLFPAWYFSRAPRRSIIAVSHTADMAEKISGKVQDNVRDTAEPLNYGLRTESKAAWQATNGCEYKAAGVGGPLTGRRADLGIIDDPVKNSDDVAHDTARDKTWDWFIKTFRTRLKPRGAIVVVMTRWHMDDLGGRLLDRQKGMWDVVSLPAQAGENDPLGRQPGEWLWGDDTYNYAEELRAAHEECELNGAMQAWSALYQQNPVPDAGNIFKVGFVPDPLWVEPIGGVVARAWDLAATAETGKNNPDWTVGVKMSRLPNGSFAVLDVIRFRGSPDEVRQRIVDTARLDGRTVTIGLPQDPGQAGKQQVLDFTRALAGYRVESSPETGDKATRAAPFASQVNVGNVSLVRGDWNALYLNELASFPNGTKDDQVDASSRAFSLVGLGRAPMRISQDALARFSGMRPPPRHESF